MISRDEREIRYSTSILAVAKDIRLNAKDFAYKNDDQNDSCLGN